MVSHWAPSGLRRVITTIVTLHADRIALIALHFAARYPVDKRGVKTGDLRGVRAECGCHG
jgi:hypothetical protein